MSPNCCISTFISPLLIPFGMGLQHTSHSLSSFVGACAAARKAFATAVATAALVLAGIFGTAGVGFAAAVGGEDAGLSSLLKAFFFFHAFIILFSALLGTSMV